MDTRGLTYRIAVEADYPFLVSLRVECGWGLPKLEKTWRDPNVVYCVLVLGPNSDITDAGAQDGLIAPGAEAEDIGMGCWMLEHADKDMASRASDTVYLSSLFIRKKYQGQGLGQRALRLLEDKACVEFGARWLTLDTVAYLVTHDETSGALVEDTSVPGKSQAWYKKEGYEVFKDARPQYLHPTKEDPERLLMATFLRKPAPSRAQAAAPASGQESRPASAPATTPSVRA